MRWYCQYCDFATSNIQAFGTHYDLNHNKIEYYSKCVDEAWEKNRWGL